MYMCTCPYGCGRGLGSLEPDSGVGSFDDRGVCPASSAIIIIIISIIIIITTTTLTITITIIISIMIIIIIITTKYMFYRYEYYSDSGVESFDDAHVLPGPACILKTSSSLLSLF